MVPGYINRRFLEKLSGDITCPITLLGLITLAITLLGLPWAQQLEPVLPLMFHQALSLQQCKASWHGEVWGPGKLVGPGPAVFTDNGGVSQTAASSCRSCKILTQSVTPSEFDLDHLVIALESSSQIPRGAQDRLLPNVLQAA